LSHVLASESMYLLAVASTPPRYHGLSKDFILGSKRKFRIAVNLLALGAILLTITGTRQDLAYHLLAIIVLTILVIAYTRMKSHKVLGFVNGDVLGFCYELTKSAILIFSAALIALRI
ncbi:MAG: adenosylcobinamide-GDP ribazoletransferase, partial [Thaumarchaeota archaeon]|nr:adenosylcobinamide-GDP ribazoletransferase [Nitrososphaerota archaeon]